MSTTVLATASAMPKTIPAGQLHPNHRARSGAQNGGHDALRDGSWNCDASNGEQFFDMELEADAEHQQDDADFCELFGNLRIGDKSRRVRTDQCARKQIPDDGRQARAVREVAQDQGGREAACKRENQIQVVHGPIVLRRLALLLSDHPFVPPRGEQRCEDRGDDDRRGDLHCRRFGDRRVGGVGHRDSLGHRG